MSSKQFSDQLDPMVMQKLMKDFQNPSNSISRPALKTLVVLGSSISDVIRLNYSNSNEPRYHPLEFATIINEQESSNESIFSGLADVIKNGHWPNFRIFAIAVSKLLKQQHPSVLFALASVLRLAFDHKEIQMEAIGILREVQSFDPFILKSLIIALRNPDNDIVEDVLVILNSIICTSTPSTIQMVEKVFREEFSLLPNQGGTDIQTLSGAIKSAPVVFKRLMGDFKSPNHDTCKLAVEKLYNLLLSARNVINLLCYLSYNEDIYCKLNTIAETLNKISIHDESAFTGLAESLVEDGCNGRTWAITICKQFDTIHPALLDALCRLTEVRSEDMCDMRLEVIRAISRIGVNHPSIFTNPSTITAVINLLNDSDYNIRAEAFCMIYMRKIKIPPTPSLLQVLVSFLVPNCRWQKQALWALGELGAFAPFVLRAVHKVANSNIEYDNQVKSLAAEVFSQLTGPYLELASNAEIVEPDLPVELKKRLAAMFEIELERKAWDWLRVFYYVGKCGSLNAAASELGLAHGNVPGRTMTEFQKCLKVRLIVSKRPQGTSLTSDGTLIWNWAKNIFEPQNRQVLDLKE